MMNRIRSRRATLWMQLLIVSAIIRASAVVVPQRRDKAKHGYLGLSIRNYRGDEQRRLGLEATTATSTTSSSTMTRQRRQTERILQQIISVSRPAEQQPHQSVHMNRNEEDTPFPTITRSSGPATEAPSAGPINVTSTGTDDDVDGNATGAVRDSDDLMAQDGESIENEPGEIIIPEGAHHLIIGINFIVSSTSNSISDHSVNTADLQTVLEVFAESLIRELGNRRRLAIQRIQYLRGRGAASRTSATTVTSTTTTTTNNRGLSIWLLEDTYNSRQQRRRRLEVSLIPNTAVMQPHLIASKDCVVSVSVGGDGEHSHCHKAHGRFQILATADESPDRVCTQMRGSINNLMEDDYLNDILSFSVPDSNLDLQQGGMDFCQPIGDYVAPTTVSPAETTAPTPASSSSSSSPAPSLSSPAPATNVFDHGSSNATTTEETPAPTPAPVLPTLPPPTAPVPTAAPSQEEFVDQWLGLLNDVKEEEAAQEDAAANGDPWKEVLDSASGSDSSSSSGGSSSNNNNNDDGPTDSAPAPPPSNRNYTQETIDARNELWDDSKLDKVIFILMIIWACCFVCVCCCYWSDAAWIRHREITLDEADEYYEHEGRWYYDKNFKFPRHPGDYPEEAEPLGMDHASEYSSSGAEFDMFDQDGSLVMSDSGDDEYSEEDGWGNAEDDYDPNEGVEESGDFYVDEEQEDVFDEDDEEAEYYAEEDEYYDEKEDFFDDEDSSEEQEEPAEESAPLTKPKRKKDG